MPSISQSELKKKDFLVVRNNQTGEVVKVVFPNGIQIGADADNFNNGIILTNLSSPPANTTNALYAVNGTVYFNGSAIGGGGGAPTNAQYVTLATDGSLTSERVLTAGTGLGINDAGAGSTVTISISNTAVSPGTYTNATVTIDQQGRITNASSGASGGAPTSAQYVTLATDATLTNERVLVAGGGLTSTDSGAGSNITLDVGAGTDITVNANDVQVNRSTLATAFAGNGLSDAGSSLAVNTGNGLKIATDAVVIDNSVVATISGTTFSGDVYLSNLFVSGNTKLGDSSSDYLQVTANSWFDNNINVSGSVVIRQDLTVNGTTTTINTANLTVKDPLIYFGSGSVGTNNNGGIALASGSSTPNYSLVWGRIANDTWGAGKQDVITGSITDLTSMIPVPIRASKFEAGGSSTYVSSSNSLTLELSAQTQVLILSGGSATSTDPRNMSDINMFVSGSTKSIGTTTKGTSGFGGDLLVSGAMRSLEIDASMMIAFQVFS